MSRRIPVLVVLGLLALLPACSKAKAAPVVSAPPSSTTTTTRPTTTTAPPVAPLTGLPAPGADVNRPVMAVKVENAPEARPQAGFESAEVVYEEVVEGGATRFILLFHVKDSEDVVGPVRSARPVDPDILVQYGKPVIVFSGGISTFVNALAQAGLTLVSEDTGDPVLIRRPGYVAPHNLYAKPTAEMRDYLKTANRMPTSGPAQKIFTFGPAGAADKAPVTATATAAVVDFSVLGRMEWDFAGGVWNRYNGDGTVFNSENGEQVKATNVAILSVNPLDTGNIDASGAPVPSWEVVGSGALTVLTSGGTAVTGTWSRPSLDAETSYLDSNGQPIPFAPGVTWVQLLPSDRAVLLS
jgi:hypothetical protein